MRIRRDSPSTPSGSRRLKRISYSVFGVRSNTLPENMFGATYEKGLNANGFELDPGIAAGTVPPASVAALSTAFVPGR